MEILHLVGQNWGVVENKLTVLDLQHNQHHQQQRASNLISRWEKV